MPSWLKYCRIGTATVGAILLAVYTHRRWTLDDVAELLRIAFAVGAVISAVPPTVVRLQRHTVERLVSEQTAALKRTFDERFAKLHTKLTEDLTRALRHAHETGVYDGALRQSLARTVGEPPSPRRRLHAVRSDREGA
jgi:hypothetical protein